MAQEQMAFDFFKDVAPSVEAGTGAAATGIKGKISEIMGGKGLKLGATASSILIPLLAQMIISKAGGVYSGAKDVGLQKEALQIGRESIDPEDIFMQAMMPSLKTAQNQAQQALISQLTGMPMQSLASGERMIGG
jgi:hypothetical protein